MYNLEFVNKVSRYTGKSFAEVLAIVEEHHYLIDAMEDRFKEWEDESYKNGYETGWGEGYTKGFNAGEKKGYEDCIDTFENVYEE